MKRWLAVLILAASMTVPVFAKGPEVDMVDNKLSVNAEAVSLGRLLRLFDLATGMKSNTAVRGSTVGGRIFALREVVGPARTPSISLLRCGQSG